MSSIDPIELREAIFGINKDFPFSSLSEKHKKCIQLLLDAASDYYEILPKIKEDYLWVVTYHSLSAGNVVVIRCEDEFIADKMVLINGPTAVKHKLIVRDWEEK